MEDLQARIGHTLQGSCSTAKEAILPSTEGAESIRFHTASSERNLKIVTMKLTSAQLSTCFPAVSQAWRVDILFIGRICKQAKNICLL